MIILTRDQHFLNALFFLILEQQHCATSTREFSITEMQQNSSAYQVYAKNNSTTNTSNSKKNNIKNSNNSSIGNNVCVLQTQPNTELNDLPWIQPRSLSRDLLELYPESTLKDLTLKVHSKLFSVHRYILAASSSKMTKTLHKNSGSLTVL